MYQALGGFGVRSSFANSANRYKSTCPTSPAVRQIQESPHPPRGAAPRRSVPWGSEPLQRRPSVEVDPTEGVSQAEVHAWINECYVSSGLTRPLTCLDYQVRSFPLYLNLRLECFSWLELYRSELCTV